MPDILLLVNEESLVLPLTVDWSPPLEPFLIAVVVIRGKGTHFGGFFYIYCKVSAVRFIVTSYVPLMVVSKLKCAGYTIQCHFALD
ncbi:hypothetical protein WDV76_09220 [Xenorhabdus griffiniae]|uniref:hypothetical protein n=1 Tax=Xenorhabdus griffiniae TaxID=351672 RepID=UPI0030D3BDAF